MAEADKKRRPEQAASNHMAFFNFWISSFI